MYRSPEVASPNAPSPISPGIQSPFSLLSQGSQSQQGVSGAVQLAPSSSSIPTSGGGTGAPRSPFKKGGTSITATRRLLPMLVAVISFAMLQITFGSICAALGTICTIKSRVGMAHTVAPIWTGCFVCFAIIKNSCGKFLFWLIIFSLSLLLIAYMILTQFIVGGCLGLLAARRRSVYVITCYSAFSVVCMGVTLVAVQLVRFGLVNQTSDDQELSRFADSTAHHESPPAPSEQELDPDLTDPQPKAFEPGLGRGTARQLPLGFVIAALAAEGAAGVVSLLGLLAGCRFRRRIEREMCRRRDGVFYVQVLGEKDVFLVTRQQDAPDDEHRENIANL